jgi:hypothetical protein
MFLLRSFRSPMAHTLLPVVSVHDKIKAVHLFVYNSAIILNLRSANVCFPASARATKTRVAPIAQIIRKRSMALQIDVLDTNLVIRY